MVLATEFSRDMMIEGVPGSAARDQSRAGLDQMDREAGAEFWHDVRGAQHVGHQRAMAGAKLDQAERCRRAHRLPGTESVAVMLVDAELLQPRPLLVAGRATALSSLPVRCLCITF